MISGHVDCLPPRMLHAACCTVPAVPSTACALQVPPPAPTTLSVVDEPGVQFPVRRVYCLCINYPEVRIKTNALLVFKMCFMMFATDPHSIKSHILLLPAGPLARNWA